MEVSKAPFHRFNKRHQRTDGGRHYFLCDPTAAHAWLQARTPEGCVLRLDLPVCTSAPRVLVKETPEWKWKAYVLSCIHGSTQRNQTNKLYFVFPEFTLYDGSQLLLGEKMYPAMKMTTEQSAQGPWALLGFDFHVQYLIRSNPPLIFPKNL